MSTPLASRSLMRNWLPLTSLGIPFMVNGTTRSGLSRFDHLIFGSPLSFGTHLKLSPGARFKHRYVIFFQRHEVVASLMWDQSVCIAHVSSLWTVHFILQPKTPKPT